MNVETLKPAWPLPLRIGFRFVFSYLMLYLFNPTAETLLHAVPAHSGFGWPVLKLLATPWAAAVQWTGEGILGLSMPEEWMDTICCALLAFVVTLVWSWLDRRRPDYTKAHAFLRGAIRLYLVLTLVVYACLKVIPVQFKANTPADLLVRFGDQTLSGLLWRFMGSSPGYTSFTGLIELLGVVLLLSPRTTLAGALVTAGALVNVIALNYWYQVGVLNTALHMLFMTLVLIAPEARRLVNLLLFHRAVPALSFPPLFQRVWLERAFIVGKYGVFLFLTAKLLLTFHAGRSARAAAAKAQPLAGIWSVEEQEQAGRVLPPLLTDTNRWRYLIVLPGNNAIVRPMSGNDSRFLLELDQTNRSLAMLPPIPQFPEKAPMFFRYVENTNAPPAGILRFEQPQTNILVLRGTIHEKPFRATLQHVDESSFPIFRRRPGWITGSVGQQ